MSMMTFLIILGIFWLAGSCVVWWLYKQNLKKLDRLLDGIVHRSRNESLNEAKNESVNKVANKCCDQESKHIQQVIGQVVDIWHIK